MTPGRLVPLAAGRIARVVRESVARLHAVGITDPDDPRAEAEIRASFATLDDDAREHLVRIGLDELLVEYARERGLELPDGAA